MKSEKLVRFLLKVSILFQHFEWLTKCCLRQSPVSEFTETLKAVSADATIERTIDRTSMQRVSTPEVIRFSAIDFDAKESTWFVQLKADAKISTVDADPESLRVNSLAEITLMESFVHWRQTVAIK